MITECEDDDELQRMQDWENAVRSTLTKYEMLGGTRKIPLLKALIGDVRKALIQGAHSSEDLTVPAKRCRVLCADCDPCIPAVHETIKAVEEAMKTKNILATVLTYAEVRDLKSFRLVSTLWHELASSELNSRNCLRIRLYFSEIDQKFTIRSKNSDSFLADLAEAFCKSTFPSCYIFVGSALTIELMLRLHNFFINHGSKIKTLHFSTVLSAVALAKILKNTPNIEYLKISVLAIEYSTKEERFFARFPLNHVRTRHDDKQVILSKLKKIKVIYVHLPQCRKEENYCCNERHITQNVFRALLEASPNLLIIKKFDYELLPEVLAVQKCGVVQNVRFAPSMQNINTLEEFSLQLPKLQQMQIFNQHFISKLCLYGRVETVLRDLLFSSQNSLQRLILQPIGFLESFCMQPLNNVEYLAFEVLETPFQYYTTCAHMFFRTSSDFTAVTFPKLRTVRFGMNLRGQYAVRYFPWDNPDSELLECIPTVESVDVAQKLDIYALRFITTKFPNITKLKLEHTRYSCQMECHAIWKFLPASLHSLELYEDALSLDFGANGPQSDPLDSAFTGFSEKTCRVLRQFPNEVHFRTLVKRQKAGICDLRGLKRFRFTFASPQSYGTGRIWFSNVTGKFAFDLMPQLEVTIAYDMKHPLVGALESGLQPIAPWVRFEHRQIRDSDASFYSPA